MMYNPVKLLTSLIQLPQSDAYSSYPDSANIPPIIDKFPPNNELKKKVNFLKVQFDTCASKEDINVLISSVGKI